MPVRHRRASDLSCLLLAVCLAGAAPAGAEEIYKWTDESGNVHFGNRKPSGNARGVEATQGGTLNQAGGAPAAASKAEPASNSAQDRKARLRRLQRENKKSERSGSKPVILGGSGMHPVDPERQDPMKSESHCKSTYGKSCSDLENWREQAVAKCEDKNSAHCKDEGYIDAQKPKTLEEQRWLQEERERNAKARYNRAPR